MALPNFLCIGAQRSGTTALHVALSKHSQAFLPRRVKEPSTGLDLGHWEPAG